MAIFKQLCLCVLKRVDGEAIVLFFLSSSGARALSAAYQPEHSLAIESRAPCISIVKFFFKCVRKKKNCSMVFPNSTLHSPSIMTLIEFCGANQNCQQQQRYKLAARTPLTEAFYLSAASRHSPTHTHPSPSSLTHV